MAEIRDVTIVNEKGLHVRASAAFAKLCLSFSPTKITVSREGHEADGCSIMDLLMLAAGPGSQIRIVAEGAHEGEAVDALVSLVQDRFGEAA